MKRPLWVHIKIGIPIIAITVINMFKIFFVLFISGLDKAAMDRSDEV